jgi:hypothetical protein
VKRLPDVLGTRPVDPTVAEDTVALQAPTTADLGGTPRATVPVRPRTGPELQGPAAAVASPQRARLRALALDLRWPLAVYGVSRLLILVTAIIETLVRRWDLWRELANWDGVWYLRVLTEGYPNHVSHAQTPLGFFPLYPLLAWGPAHLGSLSPGWNAYEVSGLAVSLITGACAVVLIGKLASSWWGADAGRRAVLFLCFFPGTVVFSMVYTEGLLLTLIAGCLLAMQRRRWLLAGVLAGFSTAVGPVAVAVIPACLVAAGIELWRHGWRDPGARRSLITPLMAPLGTIAFGGFLWIHAGSPFASYQAQRYGWGETSSPLALLRDAEELFRQVFPPAHTTAIINSNYIAGLIGAAVLLAGLVLLLRRPHVPLPALVWTLGVAALITTSAQTPPNARMLLCAFPAIIVFAQRLRGRWFTALWALNCTLFVVMSWITLVGVDLRP